MPLLDWLNKKEALQLAAKAPFRLLEEDASLSYGEEDTENMLIQGDNLDALKALLPLYAGKVKCVYIDPPYNTKSAFEHYDDNVEHSTWLSLMYPRLELLRELLVENGSIWVSIDDNEAHYLKVIMDEVFGRNNFIATVIWRKNYAPKSSARHFSEDHDYIIVYAKNGEKWIPNPMPRSEKQDKAYKNPDNDHRGIWKTSDLSARNPYSLGIYPITCPSGKNITGPPKGRYWSISYEKLCALDADNRIWWGKDKNSTPQLKRFLSDVKQGVVPQTFWSYEEVGHTQDAKKETVILFQDDVFGTPKPEKLIQRIIQIGTNEEDLILDSFLGSGTTSAVALKMNRRFIGIEIGDHCTTHCQPRLKKVIDGEQGGISESVAWKGGGGFRFFRLGPPVFDPDGKINASVKFNTLARFIWFAETHVPLKKRTRTPLLGAFKDVGYYLLFNGILGDKRPDGGNVLTRIVLKELPKHDGPKVIYGETSLISKEKLLTLGITFKQIPYDIKAR